MKHKFISKKLSIGADWEESLKGDIAWIIDRINDYEIGVTLDGKLVDRLTSKIIHENHLKCMLRRDFSNERQCKTGLDKLLTATIYGLKKMVNDPRNHESIEEIELVEEYL
jgi:hypothetical protein